MSLCKLFFPIYFFISIYLLFASFCLQGVPTDETNALLGDTSETTSATPDYGLLHGLCLNSVCSGY